MRMSIKDHWINVKLPEYLQKTIYQIFTGPVSRCTKSEAG